MSNSYLRLAEQVLGIVREPLTAKAILEQAYLAGVVPQHLYGATQHKTLHARLSEDISDSGEASIFFRTAPGVFFLRGLIEDQSIPAAYKKVHLAPPRKKELKKELMLAMPRAAIMDVQQDGRIEIELLASTLRAGKFRYLPWKSLRKSQTFIAVHSFLAMHKETSVLSYRKGRFRPDYDPLFSPRSIGFGSVVYGSDLDILFDSLFGVVESGIRDLAYGVGLDKRSAEQVRYTNSVKPLFAYVSMKDSEPPHIDVVMGLSCPEDFVPAKSALSSNDLRWISLRSPPNDLSNFEPTSRKILELGWAESFIG